MTRLWDTANGDVPNQSLSKVPDLPFPLRYPYYLLPDPLPNQCQVPTALGGRRHYKYRLHRVSHGCM